MGFETGNDSSKSKVNSDEPPHQKITGIMEKSGNHRKILEYQSAPNPADILKRKMAKLENG